MGDISSWISKALLLAGPVLLAVTVHELAHGLVAYMKGDPTAKAAGRLTLNPLKHLDLVGTLVFFITQMIGWAKPVPVDARYFKNPRQDMIWVSLAGPASNLALAAVFAVLVHLIGSMEIHHDQPAMFRFMSAIYSLCYLTVIINVGLAVFNLLPVHPLDGSHIMEGLLPPRQAYAYSRLAPYGFLILITLIVMGITRSVIGPIIEAIVAVLL